MLTSKRAAAKFPSLYYCMLGTRPTHVIQPSLLPSFSRQHQDASPSASSGNIQTILTSQHQHKEAPQVHHPIARLDLFDPAGDKRDSLEPDHDGC